MHAIACVDDNNGHSALHNAQVVSREACAHDGLYCGVAKAVIDADAIHAASLCAAMRNNAQ